MYFLQVAINRHSFYTYFKLLNPILNLILLSEKYFLQGNFLQCSFCHHCFGLVNPPRVDNMADTKRGGSPLDPDAKRFCDNDSADMNETADPAFLSSTVLNSEADHVFNFIDSLPAPHQTTSTDIRSGIVTALMDPDVVQVISKALALEVSNSVKAEIRHLHEKLAEKDKEILKLKSTVESLNVKVDALEQYSRRNNVRISGVPECDGENTDEIVKSIAKSLGVEVDIDVSHRVGPVKSLPTAPARPIIVKLKSRRSKAELMSTKKHLRSTSLPQLNANWPSVSTQKQPKPMIYINEDLTKLRASLASFSRDLKRQGKIDDTWTREGSVFLKRGHITKKASTREEIEKFLC